MTQFYTFLLALLHVMDEVTVSKEKLESLIHYFSDRHGLFIVKTVNCDVILLRKKTFSEKYVFYIPICPRLTILDLLL